MNTESLTFKQAYQLATPYRGAVRLRRVFGHNGLRYLAVAFIALAVLALAASFHAFRIEIGGEFPYRALAVFFATAASMAIGGQLCAVSNENRMGKLRFYDAVVILRAATKPTLHSFMQSRLVFQTLARLGVDAHDQKRISEVYPAYRIDPEHIAGEDVVLELIRSCQPIMEELRRNGVEEQLPKALWWARRRFSVRYEARRWWSRERLRRIPSLGTFLDSPYLATLRRYSHEAWEEKGFTGVAERLPLYAKAIRSIEKAILNADQRNVLVISEDARAAFDAALAFSAYVETGKIDPKLEGHECYVIEGDTYEHEVDDARYERMCAMVQEVAQLGGAILLVRDLDILVESFHAKGQDALTAIAESLKSVKVPVIATVSSTNYYRTLDPNRALLDYFDTVEIDVDDEADARGFLEDAVALAESHYEVIMTVDSIDEMLRLSKRMHPGFSPSFAALELFDDVVPELMKTERSIICAEDIRGWFKDKSPVEVTGARQVRAELERIEEVLSFQVLGQPAAIEEISAVLRSAFAGLRRDDRPLASFIFFGALGTGKGQAAKSIAAAILEEEDHVSIDLSEVSSPERFVEIVRDALESPKVIALNGMLRTSPLVRNAVADLIEGRTSVKNTSDSVIVACITVDDAEFFRERRSVQERIAILEKNGIPHEFSAVFDTVVAFSSLSVETFKSLVIKEARIAADRLRGKGVALEVTPALIDHLVDTLYDERFGARELGHSVARAIEDPVARALLSGSVRKGDAIELISSSEEGRNPGLITKIR
jgi:hypothetical protein